MTDEALTTLVDALISTGWCLWRTAHSNTPGAQRVHRWMKTLEPGHFVMELTSWHRARKLDRVGKLLAIVSNHEFVIRTVDGRTVRWENASFVRIPLNESPYASESAADGRELDEGSGS